MVTKTVDKNGMLPLGTSFANQPVIVDDSNPDRIVIKRAFPISAKETWVPENSDTLSSIEAGLNDARNGRFVEPPDVDADLALFEESDQ